MVVTKSIHVVGYGYIKTLPLFLIPYHLCIVNGKSIRHRIKNNGRDRLQMNPPTTLRSMLLLTCSGINNIFCHLGFFSAILESCKRQFRHSNNFIATFINGSSCWNVKCVHSRFCGTRNLVKNRSSVFKYASQYISKLFFCPTIETVI